MNSDELVKLLQATIDALNDYATNGLICENERINNLQKQNDRMRQILLKNSVAIRKIRDSEHRRKELDTERS